MRFALLIIGDEILNGRVIDTNSSYLAQSLNRIGVALTTVSKIGDNIDLISKEILRLRSDSTLQIDALITSGGIGPTHDDVTMNAVSAALSAPLVESEDIVALIKSRFSPKTPPQAALKMAMVPVGAQLIGNIGIPATRIENVYVLPGVPALFEQRVDDIVATLPHKVTYSDKLYLNCNESEIAGALTETAHAFPACKIGSYPKNMLKHTTPAKNTSMQKLPPPHRVELTFDAADIDTIRSAIADFKSRINEQHIAPM